MATFTAHGRHAWDTAPAVEPPSVLPRSEVPVYTAALSYAKYTYQATVPYRQRYNLTPTAPAGSGNRMPWRN